MSEFSESYHLKSGGAQDAVDLLRRAGIKGFVYPPGNNWVAFVAETAEMFAPDPRLSDANTALLLHYVYAEDHGWSFELFQGPEQVCAFRCEWDGDLVIDDSEFHAESLQPLLDQAGIASLTDLNGIIFPASDGELPEEPGYKFAEALGLTNYQWIDYGHTMQGYNEAPDELPDVIAVA